MVRFSVVVPAYNAAPFLEETLESVEAQTFRDAEVIAVDNASTDDTRVILEKWARDSKFQARVVPVPPPNRGPGGARNAGIASARGEFVAFLDADDLWAPDKLAKTDAYLTARPEVDLACHPMRILRKGRVDGVLGCGPRATYEGLLFRGNCVITSATAVRREALLAAGPASEDPALVGAEDYDLWLRVARSGGRLAYMEEALGTYRAHATGGLSQQPALMTAAALRVLEAHYEAWQPKSLAHRRAMARQRAGLLVGASYAMLAQGKAADARLMLLRAFREQPFTRAPWRGLLVHSKFRLRRIPSANGREGAHD